MSQISVYRNHFMPIAGLVDHVSVWANNNGSTKAQLTGDIDIKEVALVGCSIGPGNRQLHIPINGVGHGGTENDLRPLASQRTDEFRKPLVVANGDTKAANSRHIEDGKLYVFADKNVRDEWVAALPDGSLQQSRDKWGKR